MANTPITWEEIIVNKLSKKADYSFLIAPTVGADSISTDSEQRINNFLESHGCKFRLAKGYGMTEVASAVSFTPNNKINKIGSVGIPFSHTLVAIFDPETGKELPYQEQGEICISGPSVMLGYFCESQSSEEVLRMHSDGRIWMHSRDLGHMDEDGFLFVDGRLKRMLINHIGFKIFAPKIEAVLDQVPGVEKSCVIGVKDTEHGVGQIAVAFVQVTKGSSTIQKEIYAECKDKLPQYAWPNIIQVVDNLPYTRAGKVDYLALEKYAREIRG